MVETDRITEGTVLNVQRFSIHDGPGIRTVVFLKGCSLRCIWCSNPESQSPHPEVAINWHTCISCGACVDNCPNNANKMVNGNIVHIRHSCTSCASCIDLCPVGARKLYGRPMGVTEVLAEVRRDRPFYDSSNGGITISGGEPFCQAKFLLALLKAGQEKLIHTAVETCGYFEWEKTTDEILDHTDLLLFDLKVMDETRHREMTGKSNRKILRNLRKIVGRVKTIIRFPVLPGINDDTDNIHAMIKLISDLKIIERIDLIPYHDFGAFKYEMLGRKYEGNDFIRPSTERLTQIKHLFQSAGISARIEN